MSNREVMQQALEALEEINGLDTETECVTIDVGDVIAALRTAVEQQAEPVAWDKPSASFDQWWNGDYEDPANPFEKDSAVYWAWAGWKASQRQWVGLEIEEVQDSYNSDYQAQTRAVEKLLQERNG